METENKPKTIQVENGNLVGVIWFIGWLFTLAFAKLTILQGLLALIVWPYYLGLAIR